MLQVATGKASQPDWKPERRPHNSHHNDLKQIVNVDGLQSSIFQALMPIFVNQSIKVTFAHEQHAGDHLQAVHKQQQQTSNCS